MEIKRLANTLHGIRARDKEKAVDIKRLADKLHGILARLSSLLQSMSLQASPIAKQRGIEHYMTRMTPRAQVLPLFVIALKVHRVLLVH